MYIKLKTFLRLFKCLRYIALKSYIKSATVLVKIKPECLMQAPISSNNITGELTMIWRTFFTRVPSGNVSTGSAEI